MSRFEHNFQDSDESLHSLDQVIVIPLSEQEQNDNLTKSKNLQSSSYSSQQPDPMTFHSQHLHQNHPQQHQSQAYLNQSKYQPQQQSQRQPYSNPYSNPTSSSYTKSQPIQQSQLKHSSPSKQGNPYQPNQSSWKPPLNQSNRLNHSQNQPYQNQNYERPSYQQNPMNERQSERVSEGRLSTNQQNPYSQQNNQLPNLMEEQNEDDQEDELNNMKQQNQDRYDSDEYSYQPVDLQERRTAIEGNKKQLVTTGFLDQVQVKQYKGPQIIDLLQNNGKKVVLNRNLRDILSAVPGEVSLVTVINDSQLAHELEKGFTDAKGVNLNTVPLVNEAGDKKTFIVDLNTHDDVLASVMGIVSSTIVIQQDPRAHFDFIRLFESLLEGDPSSIMPNLLWVTSKPDSNSNVFETELISKVFYCTRSLPHKGIPLDRYLKVREGVSIQNKQDAVKFQNRIRETSQAKQIKNINLNGTMLFSFIDHIVDSVNDKRKVNFQQTWNDITQNETISAYNQSVDIYLRGLQVFFDDDKGKDFVEIQNLLSNIRELSQEKFQDLARLNGKNDNYQSYKQKLNEMISQKELLTFKLNKDLSQVTNQEVLQDFGKEMKKKNYKSDNELIKDMNRQQEIFKFNYLALGVGMDKIDDFIIFFNTEYKDIVKSLVDRYKSGGQSDLSEEDMIKKEEFYKNKLNLLYKQEKQLKEAVDDEIEEKQAFQEEIKEIENLKKNPPGIENKEGHKLMQVINQKDREIMALRDTLQQLKKKRKEEGGGCRMF